MVIDTSAIMSILRGESDAAELLARIEADGRLLLSAATYVELQIVCIRRVGVQSLPLLQALLDRYDVQIVPFDRVQAITAREAFLRFGKGRDPARLNFGDCMTYALAKQTGEPLLFKGNDFSLTDLPTA